jgi:hypothetical protein
MIADVETAFTGGSAMSVSPDSVLYCGKPQQNDSSANAADTERTNELLPCVV